MFWVCFANLIQDSQYGHMLALCVACLVVVCLGSMLAHDPYLIRILFFFCSQRHGLVVHGDRIRD